jgi:hypothetical protein
VSPLNTINFAKHNAKGKVQAYFLENDNYKICSGLYGAVQNVDHLYGERVANIITMHFFNNNLNK